MTTKVCELNNAVSTRRGVLGSTSMSPPPKLSIRANIISVWASTRTRMPGIGPQNSAVQLFGVLQTPGLMQLHGLRQ